MPPLVIGMSIRNHHDHYVIPAKAGIPNASVSHSFPWIPAFVRMTVAEITTHRKNGFTLLEVVIVMAIIAIVTDIGWLLISLFKCGRRDVTLFVNQLTEAVKLAQQEALLKPAILGLRFSTDGYQFYQFQGK